MKTALLSAALVAGLAFGANAQTTTSSMAGAGASATLNQINVVPGSGGGGGVGYLNTNQSGTLWVLGNSPSMAAQSYDACLKNLSVSFIGGVNIPLEIAVCWNLRMMDAMAKYPPGSNQYEMGCLDSNWLKTDWSTGTMKCTANIAKLPPNDARRVAYQGIPVVHAGVGGSTVPQNIVPPTGVMVAPTNAPSISAEPSRQTLPRCKGPNDQSQCYSG